MRNLRGLATFCCVVIFVLVGSLAARAAEEASPIDSFASLGQAIMACWKPPAGSEGSELTLRFGLTGQGALRGPPMVTYSKLIGAKDLQKAFVVSALRAVADCTPVKLTEGFGRIVAQRVLTLRFGEPAPARPAI
jgi:hypothetical protein